MADGRSEALASLMGALEETAHAASAAENRFQKEAARRAAELKEARAFAFRRLNLLRAVIRAVDAARADEDADPMAAGAAALMRETGLAGATQAQREIAERFSPVVAAIVAASTDGADEARENGAAVETALAEFEAWYGQSRGAPFLTLLERETVELPLVEV